MNIEKITKDIISSRNISDQEFSILEESNDSLKNLILCIDKVIKIDNNTNYEQAAQDIRQLRRKADEFRYDFPTDAIISKIKNTITREQADNLEKIVQKDLRLLQKMDNIEFSYRKLLRNRHEFKFNLFDIQIRHAGHDYKFGDFSCNLRLDFQGEYIDCVVENLSNNKKDDKTGRYYHPHVEGSMLCAGDLKYQFKDMLSLTNIDIIGIVDSVRQTLCTYNEGSPYVGIHHWKTTAKCFDCGKEDLKENMILSGSDSSSYCCQDCATTLYTGEKVHPFDAVESKFHKGNISKFSSVYSECMKDYINITEAVHTVTHDYIHPGWENCIKVVHDKPESRKKYRQASLGDNWEGLYASKNWISRSSRNRKAPITRKRSYDIDAPF